MAFDRKILNMKITGFLNTAGMKGRISSKENIAMQILLAEKDPPDHTVSEELTRQKKRFIAWLGVTKQTTGAGEAGKIDNLLVLINAFMVLFCVVAVVPVFFMYISKTWIIPVALLCPAIHIVAWRLARNPEVERSRIKSMHLTAAMISIVPLACVATYTANFLGNINGEHVLAAIMAGWAAYTVVVSLLVRTETGFYASLILAGLVLNICLGVGIRDYAGSASLNLCAATALLWFASRRGSENSEVSPGAIYWMGGLYLAFCFIFMAIFLMLLWSAEPQPTSYAALPLWAAALALLPFVIRNEAVRVAGDRLRSRLLFLLPVTWLFVGAAQFLAGAFGVEVLASSITAAALPNACLFTLLALVFVWSLWLFYRELMAENGFDANIFEIAGFFLVVDLVIVYFVLAARIGYSASLCLAVAVFVAVQKLRKRRKEEEARFVDGFPAMPFGYGDEPESESSFGDEKE